MLSSGTTAYVASSTLKHTLNKITASLEKTEN